MAPSRERSPEVLSVRDAMQASGVDAFLDIHGDEGLPYVFADGNERLPTYSPRMAALERGFADALVAANPDFQTVHGYPADKETKVNLTIASKWVGPHVRRPGADARDAVQGQRRPAGPAFAAGAARARGGWARTR